MQPPFFRDHISPLPYQFFLEIFSNKSLPHASASAFGESNLNQLVLDLVLSNRLSGLDSGVGSFADQMAAGLSLLEVNQVIITPSML